jgi:putative sigma-54 modulation protein
MQVNIAGLHTTITDAMREYTHNKLEKLERHFDRINNIHVTFSVEKNTQKAEATLHVLGEEIHAESVDENLYVAIDQMVDKLDRQILKHKEKGIAARRQA